MIGRKRGREGGGKEEGRRKIKRKEGRKEGGLDDWKEEREVGVFFLFCGFCVLVS